MNLSKNFTLAELTRSNTAKRAGISNTPNVQQTEALRLLAVNVLQPTRDALGPLFVSSGFRGDALNALTTGSSSTSQHPKGEAADLDNDGRQGPTNKQIFEYIRDFCNFDQLIWEFGDDNNPDWVHVSYSASGKQRKKVLKAVRQGGKVRYINL